MEEKITSDKNLIYCSTFQLAWNELKDKIIKDNIYFLDEPEMVKYLNKSLSTKKDLSEESFVALAGFAKDDILKKINAELKQKFGSEAPVVNDKLDYPDDIMAYSFLLKDLQFEKPFEDLKGKLNFENTKVKSFGINKYEEKHKEMGEQVDILFYNDKTTSSKEFAVNLKSKNSSDEIILALVSPADTILKTYEYIQKNIQSTSIQKLNFSDKLIIPKFDFNIKHSYNQLLNKPLKNKGFEDYSIIKATQETQFKLNEKGAKLKSEAKIIATKSAPVQSSKNLVFDKPFMLYMKEKDAQYPYFIMWVDNPEILVK